MNQPITMDQIMSVRDIRDAYGLPDIAKVHSLIRSGVLIPHSKFGKSFVFIRETVEVQMRAHLAASQPMAVAAGQ